MIERVTRAEAWDRKIGGEHPTQAARVIRIQFDIVYELRDTPRDTWPEPSAVPTALGYLGETFDEAGWPDLARRAYLEELEFRRSDDECADQPPSLR